MGDITGSPAQEAFIVLKGHLLDSLTLSKVMDRIQEMGGECRLDDVRIGTRRQDLSSVGMTISAPDAPLLSRLLETLSVYGATPSENAPPETLICLEDGILPAGALSVRAPKRIYGHHGWEPVQDGGEWTLVLAEGQARMRPVAGLHRGDCVVCEARGLKW